MTNIAQVAEKSCLSKSDTRLTLRRLFECHLRVIL